MIQEFNIRVSGEILNDLSLRLKNIQWPGERSKSGWDFGTNKDYLQSLTAYWAEKYNWREQEEQLNRYPQFICPVDDVNIHFYHIKGKGPDPTPLILTHGWPDSFLRYYKIIPLLTGPAGSGKDTNLSFDLIIPSLPGFGFSSLPESGGVNNARMAGLWKKLMTEKLGYSKFGAVGGDIGSGVTRYLALNYSEHLIAIHLTDVGIIRDILNPAPDKVLSPEEIQYKQTAQQWMAQEGAYMFIQSTKPQTLAYGLSDSPVGLAAWIIEKFCSWSDCNGNPENKFSKEELLNNIMIYWISNSIGTSIRMYYENIYTLPPMGKITVPTGMALFPKDILLPPKKWVEENLNVVHWTEMPRGGHFTAMEEPELFAEDVRRLYEEVRG